MLAACAQTPACSRACKHIQDRCREVEERERAMHYLAAAGHNPWCQVGSAVLGLADLLPDLRRTVPNDVDHLRGHLSSACNHTCKILILDTAYKSNCCLEAELTCSVRRSPRLLQSTRKHYQHRAKLKTVLPPGACMQVCMHAHPSEVSVHSSRLWHSSSAMAARRKCAGKA